MKKKKDPSTSNRRNNITKQCHILVLVLFTTSKAIPDISYSKLCNRVASLFAERRKTYDFRKLGNTSKISKFVREKPSAQSSLHKQDFGHDS